MQLGRDLTQTEFTQLTGSSSAATPASKKRAQTLGLVLALAALVYGFALPILGVMEIGSCTMFANMRLVQGSSNHLLKVPTGLLQRWNAHEPARAFGGGVVRVESTNSLFLNQLCEYF